MRNRLGLHYSTLIIESLFYIGYSAKRKASPKIEAYQPRLENLLRQICLIAEKHDLEQLQLSAEKDNVASITTIEHNGGKYHRSFSFDGEEAYVYLINL